MVLLYYCNAFPEHVIGGRSLMMNIRKCPNNALPTDGFSRPR